MKKIIFLKLFLLGIFSATAQNYYMSAPEGFGAATTGGGNATTITVSTHAELKAALKAVGAKIILVSGTINFGASENQISEVVQNKTIIGLSGAKLVNTKQTAAGSGILNLKNTSSNVIIRNLIFEGGGAYDIDGKDNLTADGCINLWVDHCEFQDGTDGNFDNKGNTDNVTISWCKFTYLKPPTAGGSGGSDDHRYTNLVGSSSGDKPADGKFSVTFQNCYWAEGCKERMARARNADLHILNCYYYTTVPGALALGLGGGSNNAVTSCYVENTNFAQVGSNVTSPNLYKSYTSSDGGSVNLTYDGSVAGIPSVAIANTGTVTKPTYSYTTMSLADVTAFVPNANCGAGATLSVTPEGVLSSACTTLGVENRVGNTSVRLYPIPVDSVLNINLSDTVAGDIVADIYTVTGEKVYSFSKKQQSSAEVVSLDLTSLTKGLYLCTVKIGDDSSTTKFIKK